MKYPASPLNLQTHGVPSPFLRTACRLLLRSFATISHPNALFSIGCSLFSENTRVGGPFSRNPFVFSSIQNPRVSPTPTFNFRLSTVELPLRWHRASKKGSVGLR